MSTLHGAVSLTKVPEPHKSNSSPPVRFLLTNNRIFQDTVYFTA
jgi:hypothetical protein